MLKLKLNTLATWCEELTHWKRPWCWEGLGTGGEGADRGWDGWMASPTQWTWVWVDSRSWWWTGRPGVLQFMRLQTVGHDWATELTDAKKFPKKKIKKKKRNFLSTVIDSLYQSKSSPRAMEKKGTQVSWDTWITCGIYFEFFHFYWGILEK